MKVGSRRKMKRDINNIYLDALEYGEKQLLERQAVTRKQLQAYLEDKDYKFSTKEEKRLLSDLGREAFFIFEGDPSNRKYYLNIEGYFKLLDYRELSDARESSKEARKYVFVAILISITTLVVSIVLSIMSLKQKTVIENKQFEVIENIEHNTTRNLRAPRNTIDSKFPKLTR